MKGYLIVKEAAEKFNVTERLITQRCAEGRINGAKRQGKIWLIPEDAELPSDMRRKSDHYKGYRKKRLIRKQLINGLDEFHSTGSISEPAIEKALEEYGWSPTIDEEARKWCSEQLEKIKSLTGSDDELVYAIPEECFYKKAKPFYRNNRIRIEVQHMVGRHSRVIINDLPCELYSSVFYYGKEGMVYLNVNTALAVILRRECPPDKIISYLTNNSIDTLTELTEFFKATVFRFKDELKEV